MLLIFVETVRHKKENINPKLLELHFHCDSYFVSTLK